MHAHKMCKRVGSSISFNEKYFPDRFVSQVVNQATIIALKLTEVWFAAQIAQFVLSYIVKVANSCKTQ